MPARREFILLGFCLGKFDMLITRLLAAWAWGLKFDAFIFEFAWVFCFKFEHSGLLKFTYRCGFGVKFDFGLRL